MSTDRGMVATRDEWPVNRLEHMDRQDHCAWLSGRQEILAAIHENYAFIQQLEDSKKTPQVKALIDQVSRERSENYQKFTSLIEERPVFKVKN